MLHSNRRTDAVVLDALIAETPDSDLIPKVVAGLMAGRTNGRWGNTQENVFVLLAMDSYFNTFENVEPDFIARVWLGDVYVADGFGKVIRGRCIGLADKWRRIIRSTEETAGSAKSYCYSPYEKKKASATKSLMRLPEDDAKLHPSERLRGSEDEFPFVAPTSLRDVEPSTAIWIRRRPQSES